MDVAEKEGRGRRPSVHARTAALVRASALWCALYGPLLEETAAEHPVPPRCELLGWAELPAASFADGPPSGAFLPAGENYSGMKLPFARQPVLGFSSLQMDGDRYYAVVDNGYALAERSSDFVLRIYELGIDFKRPTGGEGTIEVRRWIDLTRGAVALTGRDFDPESAVKLPDGSWWIGDEYGPYLLHFSANGELLDPPVPVAVPEGARSEAGTRELRSPDSSPSPTLARSKGIESIVYDKERARLLVLVEGPPLTSPRPDRTLMLAFDPGRKEFDPRWFRWYPLDHAAGNERPLNQRTKTGDMCWEGGAESGLLVIETDDAQGADGAEPPQTKRVYRVGLESDGAAAGGLELRKELVADLLEIADPSRLAPHRAVREVAGRGRVFSFPFATIEGIQSPAPGRLVILNDNNYPTGGGRGRASSGADATEAIMIDCRPRE